jgi:hypothetical protein
MEENHITAVGGVISSLQSLCRSDVKHDRALCKREIKERMLMEEVSRVTDKNFINWKRGALAKAAGCFNECRLRGRQEVTQCNSVCLNPLVQEIWKSTNMSEYIGISEKYSS